MSEQNPLEAYTMQFDVSTIKHLGLQMYQNLPPVIGELVSNAWDADASNVWITIPTNPISDGSEIIVQDDGIGMSDSDVREKYLVIGRDRREVDKDVPTVKKRPVMGRKGIGKLSGFGIAEEIEIESSLGDGRSSRFRMNFGELKRVANTREIKLPPLEPTGNITKGTRVVLREIKKYKTRSIPISEIRRGLARQFSIIGESNDFQVIVNNEPITPEERDMKRLLDKDTDEKPFLWSYKNEEIEPNSGWYISGWIGTLDPKRNDENKIERGIVLMARGKMVQKPFFFEITAGQPYALSYIVGEITAEFVDTISEDTISTSRNSLVWDTPANEALLRWGRKELNRISSQWSKKRKDKNEASLAKNEVYKNFIQETNKIENKRAFKAVDNWIRKLISDSPEKEISDLEQTIEFSIDLMQFDSFVDLAEDLMKADLGDSEKLMKLFREWEIVEAKEMMRVTEGRVTTIEKLENLINTNALEVPTLHKFLKEFPWIIDPRWNLVSDEKRFSDILRQEFPDKTLEGNDRRIDFLCVRENTTLVVVEIKRPQSRVSMDGLNQIERYVSFMRNHPTRNTTDPEHKITQVVGYLLCGEITSGWEPQEKKENLAKAEIYVRRYKDLLEMVKKSHGIFLERYQALRKARETR
jgi:Histidine kinase-, DNA gyrase B-, and HSP90-like ATPase